MKKLIQKLFLSIFTVAIALVLLEFLAGIVNDRVSFPHANVGQMVGGKDALEYTGLYLKDRELFWKLDPYDSEYTNEGFRDNGRISQKDHGFFRIICMGDSITFGWPADIEDTYPKLLAKLLNQYFPHKKFEVFNAGVPGYTSRQGLRWLENDIVNYEPDLIIVYYGVNDEAIAATPDKDQRLLPAFIVEMANRLRKFQLYKLCSKLVLFGKYPVGVDTSNFVSRVSSEDYKDNIRRMAELGKDRQFKTLFIAPPTLYNPETGVVFTRGTYFVPEDVVQFDMYRMCKERESEADKIFLDDVRPHNFHLTAEGQKVLAREIFNFIVDNNVLGGYLESE